MFVPFAILIAAAGTAAGGSLPTVRDAIKGCILAYTLVLVFRIVDDLADLRSDRLRHPGRVLVKAFKGIESNSDRCACVGDRSRRRPDDDCPNRALAPALLSLRRFRSSLGFGIYRRARLRAGPLAGAHILLLKYPAISLLTCASWDGLTLHTALPSFGAIYLGLCIYEQVHDRAVRESRGGPVDFRRGVGTPCRPSAAVLSTGGFLRLEP